MTEKKYQRLCGNKREAGANEQSKIKVQGFKVRQGQVALFWPSTTPSRYGTTENSTTTPQGIPSEPDQGEIDTSAPWNR